MLTTLIIFILIIGLLIFVHEFGHFISAKKAGLLVEEFGFGFPPRLFGIKRGETVYSINLIPLGGFVKILGENGEDKDNPKSFASKPVWVRAVILTAGVAMNFLLTVLLLSIGFKIGLPQVIDSQGGEVREEKIQVAFVNKNSPAQEIGINIGDEILEINGQPEDTPEKVQKIIKENRGQEIVLEIKRGDKVMEKRVTPRENPPEDEGPLGIAIVKTGIVAYPWYTAIWKGVVSTFSLTLAIIFAFYTIIKNLILGLPTMAEFAGPVGIAVMTGRVAKMGFSYLLQFVALLSINLAIINILPFPALDGGRLFFLVIEKIRNKKVSQKVENFVHMIGFALLIGLMIFVTFRDVARFKDVFINLWRRIIG